MLSLAETTTSAVQQKAVADLGLLALGELDLTALIDAAVNKVATVLNVPYCKVLELLPGGEQMLLKAGVGWQEGLVGQGTVDTGRNSQAGYTLLCDTPVIVEDLRTDSRFTGPPLLQEHEVVSGLSVVIYRFSTPWGVMGAHTTEPRQFSKQDVDFFQSVANVLASTLERNFHQEALERAQREAELANERKSEYLTFMTHELRTPLNAILGYSRMIENEMAGPLTEKQQEYIQNVSSSGQHLLDTVNSLLDDAQVEAGKLELANDEVDVSTMVEDIKSILAVLAREKQVSLSTFVDPAVKTVIADASRLKQILINLVTNAIKYNKEAGSVELKFALSEDRRWLLGEVADTGLGIAEKDLPNLFKKFYQVKATSNGSSKKGTGLGLTITQKLIKLHGGDISVASELSTGTTFSFKLPYKQAAAVGEDNSMSTLLLIEDNQLNASMVKDLLEPLQVKVTHYDNADSIVEQAKAVKPGLILLDLHLPGIDGLEAVKELKQDPETQTIPVVAFTAMERAEEHQAATDAGCCGVIIKPIDVDNFGQRVLNYFNSDESPYRESAIPRVIAQEVTDRLKQETALHIDSRLKHDMNNAVASLGAALLLLRKENTGTLNATQLEILDEMQKMQGLLKRSLSQI